MKIRNRLFIHITLSAFAMIMIFMFFFLRAVAADESERFQNKIDLYSSMLPKLFANAMFNYDNRMINYLANAVDVDPEISSLEIRNENADVTLLQTKPLGHLPRKKK